MKDPHANISLDKVHYLNMNHSCNHFFSISLQLNIQHSRTMTTTTKRSGTHLSSTSTMQLKTEAADHAGLPAANNRKKNNKTQGSKSKPSPENKRTNHASGSSGTSSTNTILGESTTRPQAPKTSHRGGSKTPPKTPSPINKPLHLEPEQSSGTGTKSSAISPSGGRNTRPLNSKCCSCL